MNIARKLNIILVTFGPLIINVRISALFYLAMSNENTKYVSPLWRMYDVSRNIRTSAVRGIVAIH